MQAIKCELCGSNHLIKKDGFFQCEHCGTKYTLEEAKKLIVSGTVEVVTGNAEKERLLNNAESFLTFERKDKAEEVFLQITNEFPDDYRGWLGLLKCKCRNEMWYGSYESTLSDFKKLFLELCDIAAIIKKLNPSVDQEIAAYIDKFLEEHLETPLYPGAIYVEILKNNFNKLEGLKKYFLEKHEKVLAFDRIRYDLEAQQDLKLQVYDEIAQTSKIIYNSNEEYRPTGDYDNRYITCNKSIECLYYYENYIGFHICERVKETIINLDFFDNYEAFVIFELNQSLDNIINDKIEEELQINRMNTNVCLYCGSKFKGFFKQVCSNPNCGKPKNY